MVDQVVMGRMFSICCSLHSGEGVLNMRMYSFVFCVKCFELSQCCYSCCAIEVLYIY